MDVPILSSLDCDSLPRWYLAAFLATGYGIYYMCEVAKVPLLACAKCSYRSFLEENLPILKEKFWPTIWCVESRAQTIFASVLRSRSMVDVKYHREVLQLKDGGEVALDWLEDGCPKDAPIVLILPGLTGSSQAEYIKCIVKSGNRSGLRTVVFNQRGLGGILLKTSRFYNACNSEDLIEVIQHIKKKYPDTPLAATGISMGGLVLGNYVSRMGKAVQDQLMAAMLISVPWDLFKAVQNIEKPGLNSMLNKYLAESLCKAVRNQKHIGWGDMDDVYKSQTIREFDSKFTCKMFGYSGTDEYYSDATLHNKLDQIRVPTLCLSAADDPFQPMEAIPLDEFNKCKHVAAVVTARGGHIGFMEGLWPRNGHQEDEYMGRIFSQFFLAIFKDEGRIHDKLDD